MKKIAIIGSGEFQLPLIKVAKEQGYETHVFSWGGNENHADYFYRISIVEKDKILQKCKELYVDGVCSIGSDLANITVGYISREMGLICNSELCVNTTTNKYLMRKALSEKKMPIPQFLYSKGKPLLLKDCNYPVIVKPTDRSGSRGISLVKSNEELDAAIILALEESFSKEILIEEFIDGREFSVESISYKGNHEILQVTEKFTTGAPDFIEKGHICPARISCEEKALIVNTVLKLLSCLNVENGACHTEVKINDNGDVYIIEIGSRMGGDFIGSDLVLYSTGFDFTRAILEQSLGIDYDRDKYILDDIKPMSAIVKFIFNEVDLLQIERIKKNIEVNLIHSHIDMAGINKSINIKSSADRLGHVLITVNAEKQNDILSLIGL